MNPINQKMKIAIHHSKNSFSENWIAYCIEKQIPYKIVDCYKTDIIHQLEDCDALMWHHYHLSARDTRFAKQLLYSLEMAGKIVYPDFRTTWHFDDKVGQKYLFEAIKAPLVPTWVFYDKEAALHWISDTNFPKVFKLRGGASSQNVRLARTKKDAKKLVYQAFSRGFSAYNSWASFNERLRKFRLGKNRLRDLLEGLVRFVIPPQYARIVGREKGYIYFQDFIPNNTHDIRVTYIFNKCFASRRLVRSGDFRASGSGTSDLNMSNIPEKAISIAFSVSKRLKLQTAAFDFVMHEGEPLIVEVSYGFGYPPEQFDLGYWDENLVYHPETFNPFRWMVEGVLSRIVIP